MSELDGKTAIVTGGGRGIGKACAEALAAAGANIVITCRTKTEGEAVVNSIETNSGSAVFVAHDVSDVQGWEIVLQEADEAFGRVDIVVANAGRADAKPIEDMSLDEFRKVNDVNLKGSYFATKYGAIAMRKHGDGGSIILISSVLGRVGAPMYTAYCASKGGVRLLAKAAALELGVEQIRVNSLHPSIIKTNMIAGIPEEYLTPSIPMGRLGGGEEVAKTVVFAASSRSKFMTGAELFIDGGWTAQ